MNESETTKAHTGIMVALFLPPLAALGVEALYRDKFDANATVTPPAELHLTLAYLGNIGEVPYDPAELSMRVSDYARMHAPITGRLNGIGRFNHTTENGTPVYISFDSPELPGFRQGLVDYLGKFGIHVEGTHGFTPHITIAYTPNPDDGWDIEVPSDEITFDELTLAVGGNQYVTPIGLENPLFVTKDAKGDYRWTLVSSSAYVDRDGEIVTEEALEKAVAQMDATGDYGDLLWWHTPVVLGKADFAGVHAHQLIESGTFVSQAVAEAAAAAAGRLGASIGFRHPPTQPTNKEYHDIVIVERSLLPRGKESNYFTRLSVRGGNMSVKELSAEKRAGLISLLGEEDAARVLDAAYTTAKAADDVGLTRKEAAKKSWWQQVKEAFSALPDPEDDDIWDDDDGNRDDAAPEAAAAPDAPAAAATDKAAKADDMDDDDRPLTRREVMALLAEWEKKAATKEADAFATKAQVEAVEGTQAATATVVTELTGTVKALAAQVDQLAGDLPRGVARAFRATQDDGTVTDTAKGMAAKAAQTNDPLDSWVSQKFGA